MEIRGNWNVEASPPHESKAWSLHLSVEAVAHLEHASGFQVLLTDTLMRRFVLAYLSVCCLTRHSGRSRLLCSLYNAIVCAYS